jgi:hypothetical protein
MRITVTGESAKAVKDGVLPIDSIARDANTGGANLTGKEVLASLRCGLLCIDMCARHVRREPGMIRDYKKGGPGAIR